MTQDIKSEVSEQLHMDNQFGFENELQLFDSIRDMFYNEDDFDEEWPIYSPLPLSKSFF